MATSPIVTRQSKAAGIVERHEAIPVDDRPGWWHVADTVTGSGKVYLASAEQCCCADYVYRGSVCKHMQAIAREAAALESYAAAWNTRAAAQHAYTSARAAGGSEQRAYADALKAARAGGADVPAAIAYANAAHQAEQRPSCPQCGAPIVPVQSYVGGRGYMFFEVCSGDGSHYSKRE